jgi:hypothetical protein
MDIACTSGSIDLDFKMSHYRLAPKVDAKLGFR